MAAPETMPQLLSFGLPLFPITSETKGLTWHLFYKFASLLVLLGGIRTLSLMMSNTFLKSLVYYKEGREGGRND